MKKLREKLSGLRNASQITTNRLIYGAIFVAVWVYAWTSGERLAYVTGVVFLVIPAASYLITHMTLRTLRISQKLPASIIKLESGEISIRLHNPSPLPFARLECVFFGNKFAVETQSGIQLAVEPFKTVEGRIPFKCLFRGEYRLGLECVVATDFTGLFQLRRKYGRQATIKALPRIIDFTTIPLTVSLVAEASSRFDIRDEDYSVISDIRPYVPTDSIKRVHWKLTAKRNEWLVKIFQSNALHNIYIVLDNLRLPLEEQDMYALEDSIIETAIGLSRYCLNHGMPVEFILTDNNRARAQHPGGFGTIYSLASDMEFETDPELNPEAVLSQLQNDAAGNVNTVIFTTRLSAELYEKTANSQNRGNYTAIMYFPAPEPDEESERIFAVLEESGLPCHRAWT